MGSVFTWPVGRAGHPLRVPLPPPPALPVALYALAAAAGGAAIGLLIAAFGRSVSGAGATGPWALAGLAGALAVLAIVLEWQGRMRPLPQSDKQVNRLWIGWKRRELTGIAWGLVIGAGVFTRLRHASAYALAAVLLLAPSAEAGAVLGGVYGLVRGLVLVATWIGDRFVGRRPRLPRAGPVSTLLSRSLALTALTATAIAMAQLH